MSRLYRELETGRDQGLKMLKALQRTGDFVVDGQWTFEVGGKGKGFSQIADMPDIYVVNDETTIGHGNKILLWLSATCIDLRLIMSPVAKRWIAEEARQPISVGSVRAWFVLTCPQFSMNIGWGVKIWFWWCGGLAMAQGAKRQSPKIHFQLYPIKCLWC